jgi:cytochrome c oxidase subunit 2
VRGSPADRLVRVRIVNPDSSHHSDGGGVHGFTIVKLGVDAKVQPETTQVVTIPPSAAGEYAFYCDTCCGGKENPSMQGVLKLKA